MTDRDALIERVEGLAANHDAKGAHQIADDLRAIAAIAKPPSDATEAPRSKIPSKPVEEHIADLEASKVQSLASPSPAQTEREPLAQPDENGCWYGVEHCTLPHCDCNERDKAANASPSLNRLWDWRNHPPGARPGAPESPSPAQWPEDVVERITEICERFPPKGHDRFDLTAGFPDTYQTPIEIGYLRAFRDVALLATLPPPEDERVKGFKEFLEAAHEALLTLKHAEVFIGSRERMHSVGRELYTDTIRRLDSALASYRGGA